MFLPKQKWLYSYLLYSSNKTTAQDHYVSLDLPGPVEDPVSNMYSKVNKHVGFFFKCNNQYSKNINTMTQNVSVVICLCSIHNSRMFLRLSCQISRRRRLKKGDIRQRSLDCASSLNFYLDSTRCFLSMTKENRNIFQTDQKNFTSDIYYLLFHTHVKLTLGKQVVFKCNTKELKISQNFNR